MVETVCDTQIDIRCVPDIIGFLQKLEGFNIVVSSFLHIFLKKVPDAIPVEVADLECGSDIALSTGILIAGECFCQVLLHAAAELIARTHPAKGRNVSHFCRFLIVAERLIVIHFHPETAVICFPDCGKRFVAPVILFFCVFCCHCCTPSDSGRPSLLNIIFMLVRKVNRITLLLRFPNLPETGKIGMQEEIGMSDVTKKALAHTLKELASRMPLDRITVSELCLRCGVNRQTFYYHFRDINDLVEYIFDSEAASVLGDQKTYTTWQNGLQDIFHYVMENQDFVMSTYHSRNREQLTSYLLARTKALLAAVVREVSAGLKISEADQDFISDFYKYAFVGLMLDWIGKGMKEDPAELGERMELVIQGAFRDAAERFSSMEGL